LAGQGDFIGIIPPPEMASIADTARVGKKFRRGYRFSPRISHVCWGARKAGSGQDNPRIRQWHEACW